MNLSNQGVGVGMMLSGLLAFIVWAFKLRSKPAQPDFKLWLSQILDSAEQGAMVIILSDPNPEKRERAGIEKNMITQEVIFLGTNKKVEGERITLQRILDLSDVWEKASDFEKEKVKRWFEMVT